MLALAGVANGWGVEGHAVIVDIAASLLTSKATQAVQKFIPGQTMDEVSSVPDDYDHTSQGSWSAPLHYINMIRGQTDFVFDQDCDVAPGCVVSAIQNYTKILQSQVLRHKMGRKNSGGDGEPNAFVFLIHFVGDAHQPLHVGYADDLGGNSVKVTWYGQSTELHRVWDDGIIIEYNSDTSSFTNELVTTIKNNQTLITEYTASMDPVTWVNESFELVRTMVYTGVDPSGDSKLGKPYFEMAIPVVKERLIAAGIRLATLLNSIFQ